jgi:hypothetical protein
MKRSGVTIRKKTWLALSTCRPVGRRVVKEGDVGPQWDEGVPSKFFLHKTTPGEHYGHDYRRHHICNKACGMCLHLDRYVS